jgi:hypothetical protein
VCALLALCGLAATPAEDWRLVMERGGVKVWSRHTARCPVHEVRAVATFDLPAARIFAALSDVENYPTLMPPTSDARLLRRDGTSAWYYMVIEPPWLSPRDYCIRITRTVLPDGRMRSEWAADDDGCPPERPGMVRMSLNEGYWLLTPHEENTTEVTYQALTDPEGAVPHWLVNHGTPGSLVDIFSSLREAAALPKYEPGPAVGKR